MVRITIYIEGGAPPVSGNVQTVDNSAVFREAFHKLFAQKLSYLEYDLVIHPLASVNQARKYLQKITAEKLEAVLLIDLDAPKQEKQARLEDNYHGLDTHKLFFMIQEMEAWILSQPGKLDEFAKIQNLSRKNVQSPIGNDPLIQGIHPEDIKGPSEKLNTLLRKYFLIEKVRKGQVKRKPKAYLKSKDGPALISLLDTGLLSDTFNELDALLQYVSRQ